MPSAKRRAQNEEVFRAVNEKISELNASFEELTGSPSGFVCECDDLHCDAQLPVPREEYDRIRRDPGLFIVKPGHEGPGEWERVVEEHDGFLVVAKSDAARRAGAGDGRA